ncbi:GMC family oxidoreductase [Shimia ponticola]|uniref:GMC family oxidoreductase n=1 Tax=Shimia ponticola TaxID=2582893 RepID=UPI0011BF9754|nr:FAD-dependent oxidoreductase [Shimia ponticola]
MQCDVLVIGGGSAGCVAAAELSRRGVGRVLVLEAGPSEKHPLVSMPFGLTWLMGGKRDWRFRSADMDGRTIAVPRGRMLGGSGSINSMVWFRGRASDFDGWQVTGWSWTDVEPAFEAVEAKLKPTLYEDGHPLVAGLEPMLPSNSAQPTPDVESAGPFSHNMIDGRRNSAATAFLRPSRAEVRTGTEVDRLLWNGDRAMGCVLTDGTEIRASKGVILSAGSLASPAILMRSGVGPADDLRRLGIDVRLDAPEVGANLHDHPGIGLHFEGAGTGYGLEPAQWLAWVKSALGYPFGKGRFTSPTVEGGAFFNARGDGAEPDVQSHFIPFHLDHRGQKYALKSGYFADVCLCRPKSRGVFRLTSKDPTAPPHIDLGLFRDESDLDTMVAGVTRLRSLLEKADFGDRRGTEVHPGPAVAGDDLRAFIKGNAGTAYHPVGTLRLGGPVTARCRVEGVQGLWVADASVMPQVTSANTNAPSMMIGWKAAEMIAEDAV